MVGERALHGTYVLANCMELSVGFAYVRKKEGTYHTGPKVQQTGGRSRNSAFSLGDLAHNIDALPSDNVAWFDSEQLPYLWKGYY